MPPSEPIQRDHGDDPAETGGITKAPELVRIGTMIQTVVSELRQTEMDDTGRDRLVELHRRSVDLLKESISDELAEELECLVPSFGDSSPSDSELRVAQAQLLGWLEGLFRGLQVAMQQRAMPSGQGPSGQPPVDPARQAGGQSGPGYL